MDQEWSGQRFSNQKINEIKYLVASVRVPSQIHQKRFKNNDLRD
jgi:hypothetical protein